MDLNIKPRPHFHHAAMATAFTLSIASPFTSWADECTPPENPLVVNITTESEDSCDDQVSLREAITYANNTLGKDTVTFSDALAGQTVDLTDGGITITEDLKIEGKTDAAKITLKANDNSALFNLRSSGHEIDFELSGATLVKDTSYDHLINMQYAQYGGDILLDNIQTTEATKAYGIIGVFLNDYNENATDSLSIKLKNSTITGSTFTEAIIDVDGRNSDGKVDINIEDSTISPAESTGLINSNTRNDTSISLHKTDIVGGNYTGLDGGGKGSSSNSHIILAKSDKNASITVTDSNIQNVINNGGTLIGAHPNNNSDQQQSNVTIVNSVIQNNTLETGIFAYGNTGRIDIKESKITGNNNRDEDFSITVYGDGTDINIENSVITDNGALAIVVFSHSEKNTSVLVKDSAIINNTSFAGGTAIYAVNPNGESESTLDLKILNSTVSGNQTSSESEEYGTGTIFAYSGDTAVVNLSLENSTISNNNSSAGAIKWGDESGNFNANINNSIVAGNTSISGSDHDLFGNFTVHNSLIGNTTTTESNTTINGIAIDQIGNAEGQTPDSGNNILSQDPLLHELTLSGGTWVHQLNASSPAIAAGNANTESLTEFDQRGQGFARVRNVNGDAELDMGAVQYFANPVAVNDSITVKKNSENNNIDILANDAKNSDGLQLDATTITIMAQPENGDVEILTDGSVVYSPKADFVGDDSFTYVVKDIDGNTSTQAKVSITVNNTSKKGSGPLNIWLLSLLALFGLRRKLK